MPCQIFNLVIIFVGAHSGMQRAKGKNLIFLFGKIDGVSLLMLDRNLVGAKPGRSKTRKKQNPLGTIHHRVSKGFQKLKTN